MQADLQCLNAIMRSAVSMLRNIYGNVLAKTNERLNLFIWYALSRICDLFRENNLWLLIEYIMIRNNESQESERSYFELENMKSIRYTSL